MTNPMRLPVTVCLVLAGLLLRELTTKDPGPGATPDEPMVALRPTASEDDVLLLMSTAGDALIEAGFDVSDRIRLALLFDDDADGRAVAAAFDVADVAGETLAVAHTVRTRAAELVASGDGDAPAEYEAVVDAGTYANRGAFTVSVGRTEVAA